MISLDCLWSKSDLIFFILVKCFGEVSEKKIGGMYENQLSNQSPKPKVPIVHYSELQAPFLVAVKERRWFLFVSFSFKKLRKLLKNLFYLFCPRQKTDLHKGGLEENIKSLNLTENFKTFIHVG